MLVLRRPHGTIALGDIDAFVARDVLHADESEAAAAFGPARQRTWAGGRAALRAALVAHGSAWTGPILSTARGAPRIARGLRASLSHKSLAVAAIVSEQRGETEIGVDLEETQPLRIDIARKVLTEAELEKLPSEAAVRDAAVRTAFSVKEAIYKALDPFVGRYIGFHEVTVLEGPAPAQASSSRVTLRTGERFDVETTWELVDLDGATCVEDSVRSSRYLLATARAKRAP